MRSGETNATLPAAAARCARRRRQQAHLGARVLAHVLDVLRADARLDDQLLAGRDHVEERLARPDHRAGRRHAQRHHLAVDRRAHDLALDLVLRRAQALLDLAHLGGGVPAARRWPGSGTGCAPARCARAARRRAGVPPRARCGLADARAVVGRGALQRQHARAVHEALLRQLLVDRQLLGGEAGRGLGRLDLRLERCRLRLRLADLRLQRGDLLVERAPARANSARSREVGAGASAKSRGASAASARGARLADALGAELVLQQASSASLRTSPTTSSGSPARTGWPSRTRISRTMPPSWCCTVLRLSSTLSCAGATTAPESGAVADQAPASATTTASGTQRRAAPGGAGRARSARGRRARGSAANAASESRLLMRGLHRTARRRRQPWAGGRRRAGAAAPRLRARSASSAPSFSTASLSSCATSAPGGGRPRPPWCRAPSARRAPRASAASPSASRFAFGSSSTTSRGSPYSARASAMRWRWPPDSTRRRRRSACRSPAAGAGSSRARARARAASTTRESTAPRRAMFSATVPANSSTSCGR